jgi:hypothetical protein
LTGRVRVTVRVGRIFVGNYGYGKARLDFLGKFGLVRYGQRLSDFSLDLGFV